MKEKILIDQLKKQMKAKGITYNQIAKALDISLSTVKRDFALKNLSLSRFLSICEITNTSLKDLSQSIEVSQPKTHVLTDEQEAFFAKNINYWAYFDQLLSGRSPSFLSQKYKITKNQEVKYLKKLQIFSKIEKLLKHILQLFHLVQMMIEVLLICPYQNLKQKAIKECQLTKIWVKEL